MSDATGAPPAWSGPGIIQSFLTIPKTPDLSEEVLLKWFDEVYVPGLLATGVVTSSWRFKAANPDYSKQYMLIHKVPDLALVQAGKLENVPRISPSFPTDEPVDKFIKAESKILSLVELYETRKQPEGTFAHNSRFWLCVLPHYPMRKALDIFDSGGESDLDAWYREEHNQQMSEQPGWKRTTRFNLLSQHRTDGKEMDRLSFLAIHEFGEGHQIGKDVVPLNPMTDWTKKCMSDAKAIDAAIYQKVKTFGKATAGS